MHQQSHSFDGGATWLAATVTGSAGRYTATWPNPASAQATALMIRVSAADASGDSITQTITHAYTIAKPALGTIRDACALPARGQARCFAEIRPGVHGGAGVRGPAALARGDRAAASLPHGYGPADLRSAAL